MMKRIARVKVAVGMSRRDPKSSSEDESVSATSHRTNSKKGIAENINVSALDSD